MAMKDVREQLSELVKRAPFAGLQEALDSGMLSVRGDERRSRRVLPDLAVESPLTRAERVRLGAHDERAPEYRRSRPRA
jgi:hypothetical protein